MTKIENVREWSDVKLIAELRNPIRESCTTDTYVPLLVEAMARLLERKSKIR